MISYQFIVEPSQENIRQIIELYQAEGWWSPAESGTGHKVVTDLVKGSHCFAAAIEADRIIGMGRAISDRASDAYIQDVTVEKKYRGRGVGSEIIKKIISRLEADGIGWIGLIAEKNSHPFYRRLDFKAMDDAIPMLRKR